MREQRDEARHGVRDRILVRAATVARIRDGARGVPHHVLVLVREQLDEVRHTIRGRRLCI